MTDKNYERHVLARQTTQARSGRRNLDTRVTQDQS